MSDKSHDAEPEANGPANDEAIVDDPETSNDEIIAELEEQFDSEEEPKDSETKPAPIERKTAKAPVKKGAPTKKRDDHKHEADDPYRAKNPVHFVKQSAGELKKVVWPTWAQLLAMFFAVLIFVLIMILIVGLLDLGFGALLLQLFGGNS